jgi:hypothetical protein
MTAFLTSRSLGFGEEEVEEEGEDWRLSYLWNTISVVD